MTDERRASGQVAKWKVWVGMVVLFASGLVCGAAGMEVYLRRRFDRFMAGGPVAVQGEALRRFKQGLDLSPAQEEQARDLLARVHKEFEMLRERHRGEMRGVLERAREEFRHELEPRQRERFERMIERMRGIEKMHRRSPCFWKQGSVPNY